MKAKEYMYYALHGLGDIETYSPLSYPSGNMDTDLEQSLQGKSIEINGKMQTITPKSSTKLLENKSQNFV